ncbi:MAG: glycosyltransferase family 39 protein [Nitrospirota bacterium]|nr:MAG: glycosyltransferase family 39 protein [Nitrospirota bacterium]
MPASIKSHSAFLLLLFLASMMFLTNIGSYAQFLRAETHFSLGARMMVETHEYLLPHAPHELPLNKTPFQYWLIGIAYKYFGFNHGAGRIPSALSGLGVLIIVYILGLRFHGKIVALTASAMLATTYLFWSFARLSMPDLLLTLCITITLACWILVLMDQTTRPRTLVLIGYGAIGLGFLVKGPVAIVLSVLPICMEIIVSRDLTIIRKLRPLSGAMTFLLVAAPYFLLVWVYHGIDPLWNFFVEENLRRFTGSSYKTTQLMFVYETTAFLADFLPWSPLLIVSLWWFRRWKTIDQSMRRQLRLLGFWIFSPILFFSLSSFKLDYYFLIGVPPAALLVALSLLQEGDPSIWARRFRLTIATLLVVALPVLLYFTIQMITVNFPDNIMAWLPHIIAMISLVAALWYIVRKPAYQAVLAFAFTLWATTFSTYFFLLPDYTRFQPPEALAARVPANVDVYAAGTATEWTWDLAIFLPTSQSVKRLPGKPVERLPSILQTDPRAVILIYEQDYKELQKAGFQFRVLAQAEAFKQNRLTLKSLLGPSYSKLYLLTQ